MNPTLEKFGYPATSVIELDHWAILVRRDQVTLGSLVLAAKDDATRYSQLRSEAFVEQGEAVRFIEHALEAFVAYEKINYLMLMMVDPNPHFHVIPRYSGARTWQGIDFPDRGWPKAPRLDAAIELNDDQIASLVQNLSDNFH